MATDTTQLKDGPSSEVKWENTTFCKHFLTSLSSLRERDIHTDVTLKADDQQFRCHRVVLSAASEYFSAMFVQGFEEANQDTVVIKGTDSETLQCIIDYIYTAKIQIKVSNVQSLTQASDMFQLLDLKDACEKFMLQQIAPSNCIGLHNFSKLFNLQSLQRESKKVLHEQFREVVRSCEFLHLDVKDLVEYLMEDGLGVKSENVVFEAVTLWLKHDPEMRKAVDCDRIMACVRFPYCTSDYLLQVVKVNEFMTSDCCKRLVEDACTFQMSPDCRPEIDSPRPCPRRKKHLVIVGGKANINDIKSEKYCWFLKEESSTWEKLTELPNQEHTGFSVCVLPAGILITGGHVETTSLIRSDECSNDCWFFHTDEKKWERTPPMATARSCHGTLLHGGKVYAIGGRSHGYNCLVSSVEVMDIRTLQWSSAPNMANPVPNPAVVSCGESIYVFDGPAARMKCSPNTQMYSSTRQEWYIKSNMPCIPEKYTSGVVAAVTLNGKIYVAVEDAFMQYEPITDSWMMLEAHRDIHTVLPGAIVVWKSKILLGGGLLVSPYDVANCTGFTDLIEEYDEGTDMWTVWAIPLKKLAGRLDLVTMDLFAL